MTPAAALAATSLMVTAAAEFGAGTCPTTANNAGPTTIHHSEADTMIFPPLVRTHPANRISTHGATRVLDALLVTLSTPRGSGNSKLILLRSAPLMGGTNGL